MSTADAFNDDQSQRLLPEQFGLRYNDLRAAEQNSRALAAMADAIGRQYKGGHPRQHRAVYDFSGGSHVVLDDTIPFPEIQVAGRTTIIPTTMKGDECRIMVRADKPVIHFERARYSASQINALDGDLAMLAVRDLDLVSNCERGAVIIERCGKDVDFRNVKITGTKGPGLVLRSIYGGDFQNVYVRNCGPREPEGEYKYHGVVIENCNVLELSGLKTRNNRGHGLYVLNSSTINGSVYAESNYGYGLYAERMGDSALTVYAENNRRQADTKTTGIRFRQGRLVDCHRNRFSGRAGGNNAFAMDGRSRRGNDFPHDIELQHLQQLVPHMDWTVMAETVTPQFHSAYPPGRAPRIAHGETGFHVTLPIGSLGDFRGTSGKHYWTPTDRANLTAGRFSDGDELALVVETECDEAAVNHFSQLSDTDIRDEAIPRLAYVNMHDGETSASGNVMPNGRISREVFTGRFAKAASNLRVHVAFTGFAQAGPDRELNVKMRFYIYRLVP